MYRAFFKRIFDFLFSLVLLLILFPFLLIFALLIKITSKGKILFLQERIGKKGKVFKICKFRTMVMNAEEKGSGTYSFENDTRITKLGKFMRKTSIDEIPQLINILYGQMSFIGPRAPIKNSFPKDEYLDDFVRKRFSVKPGVSGYAQVKGRNSLTWEEKIAYDNVYVDKLKKWGIFIDIKIFFLTIKKVFLMSNVEENEDIMRKNEEFFKKYYDAEKGVVKHE